MFLLLLLFFAFASLAATQMRTTEIAQIMRLHGHNRQTGLLPLPVIPAKAGISIVLEGNGDSSFRWNDAGSWSDAST